MSRNYGIMDGRRAPRGMSTAPAASRDTQRDSDFLACYSTLPRSKFTQAMIDVLTLFVWFVLGFIATAIVGGPILAIIWMVFFS